MGVRMDFDDIDKIAQATALMLDKPKGLVLPILEAAKEVMTTHLTCYGCGALLPDSAYYTHKGYVARRNRSTHCKPCFKDKYGIKYGGKKNGQ